MKRETVKLLDDIIVISAYVDKAVKLAQPLRHEIAETIKDTDHPEHKAKFEEAYRLLNANTEHLTATLSSWGIIKETIQSLVGVT